MDKPNYEIHLGESDTISLDKRKFEGNANTEKFREGLELAIKQYSIDDKAFCHPKEKVIDGAIRLLTAYEVNPSFTSDPERSLFALAITDTWFWDTKKPRLAGHYFGQRSAKEKKALLNILKLVATETDGEETKTLSNKVGTLSAHGRSTGKEFDPENSSNKHSEHVQSIFQYILDNADEQKTLNFTESRNDWSETGELMHVRKMLRIQSAENENPFEVVVLNRTSMELAKDLGYLAFTVGNNQDVPMIVVGNDYEEFNILEHEYAHTQSRGLTKFYQHLLFRGITEAITEASTSNPTNYDWPRHFLNLMIEKNPEYADLFYQAYIGDENSRTQLFSLIISEYGLHKFLSFARMSTGDKMERFGDIGSSILLHPFHVIEDEFKLE